jgi:membrane associated rhomboid family serine protease
VIPIATDQQSRRTPVMTAAIVAATFLAYLAEMSAIRGASDPESAAVGLVRQWGLCRDGLRWWQPVTYLLMHDPSGIMHLVGNLVFLWVFGSVAESRMGRAGFLAFYVAGGVAAGLLQVWQGPAPVIGASGAVSATSGAFIALYPRGRVLVWFLLSAVNMPALLVVGLYFALDLLGAFGAGPGNVGHVAHLGGTLFGLAVTMALVGTGVIRRTDMDMLFLLKQWRRRREMRAALGGHRGAAGPWASAPVGAPVGGAVAARETGSARAADADPGALERAAAQLADEGSEAFARGDFRRALELLERSVSTAPTRAAADESRLMVALIHARKLPDPARAREWIARVGPGLPGTLRPLLEALRAEVAA